MTSNTSRAREGAGGMKMAELNKEALKSCPFCGGEASDNGSIRYSDACVECGEVSQNTFYYCNCIKCGANNRGIIGFESKTEAVEAWNTRAALPMGDPAAWRYRYTFGGKWRLAAERAPDDDEDVDVCEPLYTADAFPPRPVETALREALRDLAEIADDVAWSANVGTMDKAIEHARALLQQDGK